MMESFLTSIEAFNSLMAQWEQERGSGTSAVPVLTRMAELMENESENFRKVDPDPFDDRHPARVDPDCVLGELLAALFKEDDFMTTIVSNYIMSSREPDLQEAACRLLLDVIPGLETSIIFQETDGLLSKFIELVEHSAEPLRSYATGLLAAAMEVQDIADAHREANTRLVPMMLQRLHDLKNDSTISTNTSTSPIEDDSKLEENRLFKCFSHSTSQHNDVNIDLSDISKTDNLSNVLGSDTKDDMSGIQVLSGDLDNKVIGDHDINMVGNNDMICDENKIIDEKAGAQIKIRNEKQYEDLNETVHPTEAVDSSVGIQDIKSKSSALNSCNKNVDTQHLEPSSSKTVDDTKPEDIKSQTRHQNVHRKSNQRKGTSKGKQNSKSRSRKVSKTLFDADLSNSSWVELSQYIVGSHSMYPVTAIIKQRFILEYLTPLGEYQELLGTMFENGAMDLVMHYIDLQKTRDVHLTFVGLRYLAALLCHKKFAVEFVELQGVQKLLETQRPSLAATGVSLCIYYLAYNEGTMERMCLLPGNVLMELMEYALWLLECSHESGRCHATMFFTMSLPFGAALDFFDKKDGLRKLVNTMSTLRILTQESEETEISDDEMFTNRQTIKHTCLALKRYFETHLAQKMDSIKRAIARNQGLVPPDPIPPYKAYPMSAQITNENMEAMLEEAPLNLPWEPIRQFMRLQGVPLLIKAMAVAYEWKNYSGRGETIKAALDVLSVLTVTSKGQLQLCESVTIPQQNAVVAMNVINFITEGENITDPEVQKAALQVIINCVCGPTTKFGVNIRRFIGGSTKKTKLLGKNTTETLEKLWDCVRNDNGIKTLLNLLQVKTPITEADSIRALACKALCGLSRSERVKQILSKLPLFSNSLLQGLMREPVLQDKRNEHIRFCKYASELIERVTGKPMSVGADATVAKLHKANIVAQTRITYSKKELLQLIHNHLIEQGLKETADTLQREATLPHHGHGAHPRPVTPPQTNSMAAKMYTPPKTSPTPSCSQPSTSSYTPSSVHDRLEPSSMQPHTSSYNTPNTPHSVPSRIVFGPESRSTASSSANRPSVRKKVVIREKTSHTSYIPNFSVQKHKVPERTSSSPPSLDLIVSNYLKEQHANCKNPVVACPEFSLLEPHHCPEPKFRRNAPINAMSRLTKRSINPTHGGVDGVRCSRQFVYSRFRPVQTYRDLDDDNSFTCCAFSKHRNPKDMVLWLGNFAGNLKAYNIYTGVEEATYSCHDSPMKLVTPSKDGRLVLTSGYWSEPLSTLWGVHGSFEKKYEFGDDEHVEFGKLSEDRIIGTRKDTANIYDTITGRCILSLQEKDLSNHYTRNCATFDPTDDLVLNDGVLWDVRSAKSIYKFDQFQNHISGLFHPCGLEIMINSEIWDIRTFHLLQTVPALDQCKIVFNSDASVIYGTMFEVEEEELTDGTKCPFGSSFRTFDGTDYTPIATIDVKKNIYDLATNPQDTSIAVLEHQGNNDSLTSESVCHIYDVGRLKVDEEDDEDEEQDEDANEDNSDDDDDDSLDDILNSDSDSDINIDDEEEENNEANGTAGDGETGEDAAVDDDGDDDVEDLSDISISMSDDSFSDDDFDDVLFW